MVLLIYDFFIVDKLFPARYVKIMKYELHRTEHYDKWFAKLKDRTVKLKVLARLARVENGNFGDISQLGENLFELRFFFAGGLRIYYTIRDGIVVILLAGGDKTTQARDIEKAAEILHGGFTYDHQDQTI